MPNIYTDGSYLKCNPSWHKEDSVWKAKQVSNLIKRHDLRPSAICEIGCGAGGILLAMSQEMPDVHFTGFEISAQAYSLCVPKAGPHLAFVHGEYAGQDEGGFDILLVLDVLEHIEDYYRFLRNIKNGSRYKIFHVPLDISVLSVMRAHVAKHRMTVGHIHYFTKETVLAALTDMGYRVHESSLTRVSMEIRNVGLKARLMNLVRKILCLWSDDLSCRIMGGFSLLVLTE